MLGITARRTVAPTAGDDGAGKWPVVKFPIFEALGSGFELLVFP